MFVSYRVWDGVSMLGGNTVATPEKLVKAYNLDSTKQLILYKDKSGNESTVKVYPASTSKGQLDADFNKIVTQQQESERAAEEEAMKPKIEDRIAALEAVQLSAMGV